MSVAVGNSLSEFWTDMCSRWLSPCDDSKRLCSLMIYCCISEIDILGFPGGSDDKASVCNAGDLGSIPGLGRSPGQGNGSPLQYSCLENPMDRGAWPATVHGVAKSQTWLSDFTSLHFTSHVKDSSISQL